MESKRISIVKLDVDALVAKLNKAMSDEWLAYYQYWISAKVIQGPLRGLIVAELLEHAPQELQHANLLANRIIQLNGTPLLSPESWFKESNCGYLAPSDPHSKKIVDQIIEGEQCAINEYNNLLEMTKDRDVLTYQMLLGILKDEVEHEEEFQVLQEDLKKIG